MMQLIRSALDAFKIVAKRSYDCLFHRARFLCHTGFGGLSLEIPRLCILRARSFGVNAPAVPVCLIVA